MTRQSLAHAISFLLILSGVYSTSYVLINKLPIVRVFPTVASIESRNDPKPVVLREVRNFVLFDVDGKAFELNEHGNDKAIVFISQGNGCPIIRKSYGRVLELQQQFSNRGISFYYINANSQDSAESIVKEAKQFNLRLPVLLDQTQLVTKGFGIERTATAVVVDPRTWTIAYSGPIDDRLGYEVERSKTTEQYLSRVLTKLVSGNQIVPTRMSGPGCLINFERSSGNQAVQADLEQSDVYSKTIAPILINNCQSCHSATGVGPWSMDNYGTIKGWSAMIREVLLTKRMPPWAPDPQSGDFIRPPIINSAEVRAVVDWIDSGAPRGQGEDPLLAIKPETRAWPLGQPDVILDFPADSIPATGQIPYRFASTKLNLGEQKWLRAVDARVSNPKVMHHMHTYAFEADRAPAENFVPNDLILVIGPAGTRPSAFPKEIGKFIRKDNNIVLEVHYITTGKEEVNSNQIGLYFHKEPPELALEATAALDAGFVIPAGEPNFTLVRELEVRREILAYGFNPHMHYRGKSARYDVVYPSGKKETLLSVPKYSFDWQSAYTFRTPILMPVGTRIICTGVFDNSPNNPKNPDPTRNVGWGFQTEDEMYIFYLGYTETDPKRSPKYLASLSSAAPANTVSASAVPASSVPPVAPAVVLVPASNPPS